MWSNSVLFIHSFVIARDSECSTRFVLIFMITMGCKIHLMADKTHPETTPPTQENIIPHSRRHTHHHSHVSCMKFLLHDRLTEQKPIIKALLFSTCGCPPRRLVYE